MRKMLALLAALWAAAAAPAKPAPPPPAGEEVSIPFVRFGGIWSFDAPSDDLVYIQDRSGNWYRAQLYGPCIGLSWAHGLGVDTHGSDTFDRYSALIVGRQRCRIESLTRSGPPPRRHHGKDKKSS